MGTLGHFYTRQGIMHFSKSAIHSAWVMAKGLGIFDYIQFSVWHCHFGQVCQAFEGITTAIFAKGMRLLGLMH